MKRILPFLLVALIAGCSRSHPEDAAPPGDSVAAETTTLQGAHLDSSAASAPNLLEGVYVDRGVCPFECCTYRDWSTMVAVPVYVAEGDSSKVAFSLEAGQGFTAQTGNVHVRPLGLAVMRDTATLVHVHPPGPLKLAKGDSMEVISPVGEGYYRVRYRGTVYEAPGIWEMGLEPSGRLPAKLVRRPKWTWWVRIRTQDGREGWINMNPLGGKIRGADGCGA